MSGSLRSGLRTIAWLLAALGLVGAARAQSSGPSDGWTGPRSVLRETDARDLAAHLVVAPDGVGFLAVDSLALNHVGPFASAVGVLIRPDGMTGSPEVVAPAREDPYRLGLGIDAAGTVTAGYTSGNGRSSRVLTRTRPLGGRFGAARQISPPGEQSTLLNLHVAPNGFAVALLKLGSGSTGVYELFARERGRSFHRVLRLTAGAVNATVAAADDDRVLIVWSKVVASSRATVEAVDWTPRSNRTVVRTLGSEPIRGGLTPYVGIVSGGGALVAWQVPLPGGRALLKAATRRTGGRPFSAAAAVTSARDGHDAGEVHLDSGADSLLLTTSESQGGGPYRAMLRTWTPAAGLSRPIVLSPAGSDAFAPSAASRGFRTLVAWQQESSTRSVIAATASARDRRFPVPSSLSDPTLTVQSSSGPYVAVDNRGVGLVTWIDYGRDNSPHGQVELARLAN